MKRLILTGMVMMVGLVSSVSADITEVLKNSGVGIYFKSSEWDQISPAGIGIKTQISKDLGFQVLYIKNRTEFYSFWDGRWSKDSGKTSNLRIRGLKSIRRETNTSFSIGIGYVKEKRDGEYEYYSPPSYFHSDYSADRSKIECLGGIEHFLVKWLSLSGEIGVAYTYSKKNQNASLYSPDNQLFAEMAIHLYLF